MGMIFTPSALWGLMVTDTFMCTEPGAWQLVRKDCFCHSRKDLLRHWCPSESPSELVDIQTSSLFKSGFESQHLMNSQHSGNSSGLQTIQSFILHSLGYWTHVYGGSPHAKWHSRCYGCSKGQNKDQTFIQRMCRMNVPIMRSDT